MDNSDCIKSHMISCACMRIDDALLVGAMINERRTINYGMPDSTVELHRNYEQCDRNKIRARKHRMKVSRLKRGDMSAVHLLFPGSVGQ